MDESETQRLIGEYLAWLVRRKRAAPATTDARQRILNHANRHLPHGLLWAEDVELDAYLSAWEGWSYWTYFYGLTSFYGWAVAKGKLTLDPMAELAQPIRPECRPRPQLDEHLAVLLAAAEPIPTITLLGWGQGLRRSEIAGLWREQVTEQTTYIARAKGGRSATTPTHPAVWAHVRDMPPGPLVRTVTGRQASPEMLGVIWRQARAALGLPVDVVPHRNRHRFGTDVRRATGDPFITMRAMRHADVRTTIGYTQITEEEVVAAVHEVRVEPAVTRLDASPAQAA